MGKTWLVILSLSQGSVLDYTVQYLRQGFLYYRAWLFSLSIEAHAFCSGDVWCISQDTAS